ncbi:MAG: hypothetical protein WCP79_15425 [Bacillota bacterium]
MLGYDVDETCTTNEYASAFFSSRYSGIRSPRFRSNRERCPVCGETGNLLVQDPAVTPAGMTPICESCFWRLVSTLNHYYAFNVSAGFGWESYKTTHSFSRTEAKRIVFEEYQQCKNQVEDKEMLLTAFIAKRAKQRRTASEEQTANVEPDCDNFDWEEQQAESAAEIAEGEEAWRQMKADVRRDLKDLYNFKQFRDEEEYQRRLKEIDESDMPKAIWYIVGGFWIAAIAGVVYWLWF